MTLPTHLSNSSEWYTPKWLMDKVHKVIDIDFDPCSSEFANKTVRANTFLSKETNGITTEWPKVPTSIFMNPPSGGRGRNSLLKPFWNKLVAYRNDGYLSEAIFLAFSIEQLQTSQNKCLESLGSFPICIPKNRVKFVSPLGDFNSPTHSQAIVYIPGIENNTTLFLDTFSDVGDLLLPYQK